MPPAVEIDTSAAAIRAMEKKRAGLYPKAGSSGTAGASGAGGGGQPPKKNPPYNKPDSPK